MKKYLTEKLAPRTRKLMVRAASITLLVALTSCGGDSGGGDPEDDPGGGIFGTGIQLDGTVSSQYALASNTVEYKRQSGESGSEAVRSNGTFAASGIPGTGAVLLRTEIANGEKLYAMAVPGEAESINQNIHSYSDLVARNWFASNGQDIDAVFNSSGAVSTVPTAPTLRSLEQSVSQIYSGVQGDYNLDGVNIFNDEYVANGSGIDGFVINNPVIINNGTINIYFVDPSTNAQSQAATDLSVDNNLLDADTQNPTAPTSVRALPAASNEILVVWDPASDNVAVTRYDIYRNGELAGSTAYQVFSDIPLTAGTQYTYTVVAIDSSGNQSSESQAVTAETLGQPDTDAPLAPTNFTLQTSVGSISLNWSHPANDDVASYIISRGVGTGALSEYLSSSSLTMTDANVVGGTQYCYQVVAVDASANESAATETLCTTTEGQTTVVPTEPEVQNPPTTDPAAVDAPMVDVSATACTTELESYTINTDTTLEAGCYLVDSSLNIRDGNLTLKPGVILKFAASRILYVNQGASLTAEGTAANPIVFTAVDPTPGFWGGIQFTYSNSSRNKLKYVQVEYAGSGSGDQANVELIATSSSPSRVSISNSTLQHSSDYGFIAPTGTLVDEFASMRIAQNEAAMLLTPNLIGALSAPISITGNQLNEIELTSTAIVTPVTFLDLGVPYRVPGMNVSDSVEFAANTIFKVESGKTINVQGSSTGGSLKITGTPERPVVVTGVDPTAGSWGGISYNYSNSANNVISNAVIEYGGSGNDGANVDATSTPSSPTRIAFNNVTLRNALNYGFAIDRGSIVSGFDSVVSSGNGAPGRVNADLVGSLSGSTALTGNTVDQIIVTGSGMSTEQTWPLHDVPYFMEDGISVSGGLTLTPGTRLIFDSGTELSVQRDAYLKAVGLPSAAIVFTGGEAVNGYWKGIHYQYTPSAQNILDHTIVEYGGQGTAASDGNIEMNCTGSSPARLQVSNTQITDSSSWGIELDANGCDLTLGANVTFARNASGDVETP